MRKHSLLIVDDNPVICMALSRMLEENYFVDIASNGEEGLKLYQEHFHHIVLTDWKMPNINGIDLLCKLKALNPKVKVVIMTSYSDLDLFNKVKNSGAAAVIFKPFKVEELIQVFNNL